MNTANGGSVSLWNKFDQKRLSLIRIAMECSLHRNETAALGEAAIGGSVRLLISILLIGLFGHASDCTVFEVEPRTSIWQGRVSVYNPKTKKVIRLREAGQRFCLEKLGGRSVGYLITPDGCKGDRISHAHFSAFRKLANPIEDLPRSYSTEENKSKMTALLEGEGQQTQTLIEQRRYKWSKKRHRTYFKHRGEIWQISRNIGFRVVPLSQVQYCETNYKGQGSGTGGYY